MENSELILVDFIKSNVNKKWKEVFGDEYPDFFEMRVQLVPKKVVDNKYEDDNRFKTVSMYVNINSELMK